MSDYKKLAKLNNIAQIACNTGDLNKLKEAISAGADFNNGGGRLLMSACEYGRANIVEYLIDLGINVHAQNGRALIDAVWSGNLQCVKLLIENGVDINTKNSSVLLYTQEQNNKNLDNFKYLISKGAKIENVLPELLSSAIVNINLEMISYLIEEHGVTIDVVCGMNKNYGKEKVTEWCNKYIEIKSLQEKLNNDLIKKEHIAQRKKL